MLNINTNYGALFASNAAKNAQRGLIVPWRNYQLDQELTTRKMTQQGQAIATRITAEVQGLKWHPEMHLMHNLCWILLKERYKKAQSSFENERIGRSVSQWYNDGDDRSAY